MARLNVLDEPVIAALRDSGADGALALDVSARVGGVGSARGVQFALKRLLDTGVIARKFEWTFHDNGKPRARVYRYYAKEFAPDGAEMV